MEFWKNLILLFLLNFIYILLIKAEMHQIHCCGCWICFSLSVAKVFWTGCQSEGFYRPQVKVMFSEASVILSTGRGMVSLSVWYHVPSRMGGLPQVGEWVIPLVLTSSGEHCSGRYASYWNAFLFFLCSVSHFHVTLETRNFAFAFTNLCDEQTRRAQKTCDD